MRMARLVRSVPNRGEAMTTPTGLLLAAAMIEAGDEAGDEA
jgi:hypothetical protein